MAADVGAFTRYKNFNTLQEEAQKNSLANALAQAQLQAVQMEPALKQAMFNQESARKDMEWQRDANLKRELANLRGGNAMMLDPDTNEIIPNPNARSKPIPVGALTLQDEITQSIAGTGNIATDAAAQAAKIKSGAVPLEPTGKLEAFARNKLGMSDEQSRAYAGYTTFVEKLRNDTLRLNKGVQTEGDAQRALNELIAAGNDRALAASAMEKIANINNRALELQKQRLRNVRGNYGLPELDLSSVTGKPLGASVSNIPEGATATNPQTGQKIKRVNGQWVPQ